MRSSLSRRIGGSLALAAITSTAALVAVPAAQAAVEHPDLARSMFADPAVVVGSSFPDWYHQDAKVALGNAPTGGFPRSIGGDFAVLSSGRASNVFGTQLSNSYFGAPSRGDLAFDAETFKVDIVVPNGVNCLTGLDFRVASTEAPGGRPSGFVAELDETTWTASSDEGIKAPGNFAGVEGGTPVGPAITSGPAAMQSDAIGSYPTSTGVLTASTPISPGAHSLYLSVFDAETAYSGTTVLIDNIRFGHVDDPDECVSGARGAQPPAATQVTSEAPGKDDPYGTEDDAVIIPNTAGVRYSINGEPVGAGRHRASGTVSVTAAALPGFELTGETTWSVELTNVPAPASDFPVSEATSSGAAGELQRYTGPLPGAADMNTDIRLFDKNANAWVHSLKVDGVGYYSAGRSSTDFTLYFSPSTTFTSATAEPVPFRVTHQGKTGEATYTVSVGAPTLTEVTAEQPTKVDDWGTTWDTYTIPSTEGVHYLVDGEAKKPGEHHGAGTVTVTAEAEKGYELSGDTTFTLQFDAEGARDVDSSDVGTVQQVSTDPMLPEGATVALLDGENRVLQLETEEGTFTWDGERGRFTFVPTLGFSGTASAPYVVSYRQRDFEVVYRPTVAKPPAPVVVPVSTSGGAGQRQRIEIAVPAGGSVRLVDAHGNRVKQYTVVNQGTYEVDGAAIAFTPRSTFHGKAQAARYVLVDAYGQVAETEYAATVIAKPKAAIAVPARTVHATRVSTVCTVTVVDATSCSVNAFATVNGKRTRVGSGKVKAKGTSGRVTVPVKLSKTGRTLAARPQGLTLSLEAALVGTDRKTHQTTIRTHVVAPKVSLRPIYFAADSAKLSTADRAYLPGLRSRLSNATSVTITGFADARATKVYNSALGRARAKAVADVLTRGTKVKVTSISRGEAGPAATNRTRDGRAKNRRVEVQLSF